MPAGCKECSPNEWQCGSDTTELCSGSGGWTAAGALCLQLYVRKDPETKSCLVKVVVKPLASCDDKAIVVLPPPFGKPVRPVKKKAAIRKK